MILARDGIQGTGNVNDGTAFVNLSSSTIPLLDIDEQAKQDALDMIINLIKNMHNNIWMGGNYFTAEASFGYLHYQNYKQLVNSYKNTGDALGLLNVPLTIYDAFEQSGQIVEAGPNPYITGAEMAAVTAFISFEKLYNDQNDAGPPDYSGAVAAVKKMMETGLLAAKAKYEYIMSSDYKFLIAASGPRNNFLDDLDGLKEDIKNTEFNNYNSNVANEEYKSAILDYVDEIYDMNKNYETNRAIAIDAMQELEDNVNRLTDDQIKKQINELADSGWRTK